MLSRQVALVGRDGDVAVLENAFAAACDHRPSLVIVSGEAGIGKSRLIEEFTDRAGTGRALVVVGRCVPVGASGLSYAPVIDVLQQLSAGLPDLERELPSQLRRSIGPLFGRMDAHDDGEAPGLDLAMTRMFAGVVETLAVAAELRPLVIVVEDVHWADRSSLDLLDFVARRLGDRRLLLVVTVREDNRDARISARPVLSELLRLPSTTEIALEPLARDVVEALLSELPDPPAPELRRRICDMCEGNPFFALHLAAQGDRVLPSPGLRSALLAPLDGMAADARELLLLLAVFGRPVASRVVTAGLQWPPGRVNAALRVLLDVGTATVRGQEIAPRHALLREAIVDEMLPSEQVVAHHRAATGLLDTGGGEDAERSEELSIHLLGCGRNLEAVTYALRGARYAARVWAFPDARRLYAAVRRLWPVVATSEARARAGAAEGAGAAAGAGADENAGAGLGHTADVLLEAAVVSRWCGEFDESLDLLGQAFVLPDLTVSQQARIAQTRSRVLWASGDLQESLAALTDAEQLLTAQFADPMLRVEVTAALAAGRMRTGQAALAVRTAEQAIELAKEIGAAREELDATITLGTALGQLGDVDIAVKTLRACLPVARARDELDLVVRAYGNLTFVLAGAGRYAEADRAATEGEGVCHRYGPILRVASTIVNNHVSALVSLGRWDDAQALAQEALDEAMPSGIALYLHLTLAKIAAVRGDRQSVERRLAHADALETGNPYARLDGVVARAESALWSGRPREALDAVEAALPLLSEQDDAVPILTACWLGLRAVADLAATVVPNRRNGVVAHKPSHDATADLLDTARLAAAGSYAGAVAATLALCEAEAGRARSNDADDLWAAAAAANPEPYLRAYALYRRAAGQGRRHATSAVASSLTEARTTAQTLGARPMLHEIDALAAAAGVAVGLKSAPAATVPFGLTPRELEVLQLLASGATNRLIARTLFISERTAGVHVGNILAKLGVGNRTEAARIAMREGLDAEPAQSAPQT